MKIGQIDLSQRVLVVAEIGNNHEGDAEVAERLVHLAADAGADAVKMQTFRTEHYVSRADEVRYRRLQSFELSGDTVRRLAAVARDRGVLFIATPFDLESARTLEPLVDAYKVASGDNSFYPLLEQIAASSKPVIVSSGLADLDDIARTYAFVTSRRPRETCGDSVAVLHCVSAYPVEPAQVNLRAIPTLAAALGCVVGYSDHTLGIDAVPAAVALGARIVEKHFTLSRTYSEFRDHALSADPAELRELVRRVRAVETMLGSGVKAVQPAEAGMVTALRRSVVAAADLRAGHVLRPDDITWVRPGGGLAPGDEHRVVGRPLRHDVRCGDRLHPTDVEA